MKILSISRGQLEIARAHLHRSMATIGRSPACDVVLRAPGVEAVQFVLEWVGVGQFDASKGSWSIFNVSKAGDVSGEGVLLEDQSKQFGGFTFEWVEDSLEHLPEIGGAIRASLDDQNGATAALSLRMIELIHVRSDSGTLEEVIHMKPKPGKKLRPLSSIPEFRVMVPREQKDAILRVLLEEMPGAEIHRRGAPVSEKTSVELVADELLKLSWKGHIFFLRFVREIRVPSPKRAPLRDRLLLKLLGAGTFLGVVLLGVVPLLFRPQEEPRPEAPPRIATVEIKAVPEPPPEAYREPPKSEAQEPPAQTVVDVAPKTPKTKPAGLVTAARQAPKPSKVEKAGLNSPADVRDVNMIGLLGALKSKAAGPKGAGISADRILNQGIITESVSANSGSIVLKTAPQADLGGGKQGVKMPGGSSSLARAATTLQGGKGYDPKSIGAIGLSNKNPGYKAGNSLATGGEGLAPGWDFGRLDTRAFSVAGGLDRETVRRVIAQTRNQIRACYEKALLSNPHLAGRVSYRWNISPAGPVTTTQVTTSNTGSAQLESCVLEVIKQMKFPAAQNGQPTTVIYPFIFQAKI
ncbi:MAG: hypothetical protein A2X94_06140 [Bdellovibrionales bacterium GWB1_55_8]|nr:MAG: hypothetical protein A2X94_06140 [Bdellovibrionales bacterium GWB1_55_8]